MKNLLFYTFFTVLIILFVFPLYVFSQSVDIINSGNNIYVVKRNRNSRISVAPSFASENLIQNKYIVSGFSPSPDAFSWTLKFTASGKVFKDISFATSQHGYIVTELGCVYKTTNGGDNWVSVMNLGFPYYWYGVYALSPDTVVIAGFNNQGNIRAGVVRWSFNGGASWSSDIRLYVPAGVGWLSKIHFFDVNRGLVSAEFSGGMHYTTNGGKDSAGWNYVQVNSDLGWFAGNIDALPDGNVFTTGIHFAHSTNYGINWTSGPSADYTFDGGVDFTDNNLLKGMTGGGSINPNIEGWMHRTTDGSQTWSARLNTFPYPVRSVKYLNDSLVFAFGGNLYQDAGGIWFSSNAGQNWNLEISTGAEMFSYDLKKISADSIDIWCVGSTGGSSGYTGKLYKARIKYTLTGLHPVNTNLPSEFKLYQNYPNPFNPSTIIKFSIPKTSIVLLEIYDILGRIVTTLVNEKLTPGSYEIPIFVNRYSKGKISSGIYFYKLQTDNFTDVKRMLIVK